jgi:hypothetical protein
MEPEAGADVPVFMTPDAPVPDSGTGSSIPPSTTTGNVVTVNECSQINCPRLTALATECDASQSACEMDSMSSTTSNFCHENGVKKQSTRVYSGDDGTEYMTTLRVRKPGGDPCYTLQMSGHDEGDVEYWVFESPAGEEVARGEWSRSSDQLTLICDGVRFLIGPVGCPGTDGEPAPDECNDAEGNCEFP